MWLHFKDANDALLAEMKVSPDLDEVMEGLGIKVLTSRAGRPLPRNPSTNGV